MTKFMELINQRFITDLYSLTDGRRSEYLYNIFWQIAEKANEMGLRGEVFFGFTRVDYEETRGTSNIGETKLKNVLIECDFFDHPHFHDHVSLSDGSTLPRGPNWDRANIKYKKEPHPGMKHSCL